MWVEELRQIPTLGQAAQVRLVSLLSKFVIERFSKVAWKEIEKMLQLTPLEETRAGQDLIQIGVEQTLKESVLANLETRFGTVSSGIVARVESMDDLDELRHLRQQSILVASLEEFKQLLQA